MKLAQVGMAMLSVVGVAASLSHYATAAVDLTVACESGCSDRGKDPTPDLLLREDEAQSVTLVWTAIEDPVPKGQVAVLYAGNPASKQIPEKGILQFNQAGNGWQARREFLGSELGRGTFIGVIVLRSAGAARNSSVTNGAAQSSAEIDNDVLDWRAFRLLTTSERRHREDPPPAQGQWSVDVQKWLLRVSSGHGDLPRSLGGDRPVWWPLSQLEGDTSDLDLDGDATGIAGLVVQVATPWDARPETWKDEIQKRLGDGVEGHAITFDDMKWIEVQERSLELGGQAKKTILLRNYYTMVTLFTNADSKPFSEKDVNDWSLFLSRTYFSHETSARLKHPDDPRFWASYSPRDHSEDPRLLNLLKKTVQKNGKVPGWGVVQQVDGEGGSVKYHTGFFVRVRPWEHPSATKNFRAGIVGLDVVAARAGYGGVIAKGNPDQSEIGRVWCDVIHCKNEGKEVNLGKPPKGYRVEPPSASLATLSGALPMIEEKPQVAERGLFKTAEKHEEADRGAIPNLPSMTRFGVSANLRAGALIQTASFGHTHNMVPINSYAQFVVKITVAMLPTASVVTNKQSILPGPFEFQQHTETPKPPGFFDWLGIGITELIGAIATLLVVLAIVFIPGVRQFVGAIFGLFAAVLNRITKLIQR